jgi:hypothetical protein
MKDAKVMSSMQYCDISRIECRERNGTSRVSAMVNGEPLWFESADAALRPSAEAIASAFLVPALHHHMPMRVDAPLSALWLQDVPKIFEVYHEWWDYPSTLPIDCQGEGHFSARKPESGQCFSGGCDSFYSLLRGKHQTKFLVFVHGFDISYRDKYRMNKFKKPLEEISQAVGKPVIMIRTNLRKHGLFASVPWERSHGGALATMGHLLSNVLGTLIVPSSFSYDDPHPCGSHWLTDKFRSSENLEIIHDEPMYRLDKLKLMDSEPLVRRHLRVCWENKSASGNCSRCDKCVRTMIVLFVRGQLKHYPGFDQRNSLPNILDGMDPVDKEAHRRYHELIKAGLPADIEAAIRRLLARDKPPRFSSLRHAAGKVRLGIARMLPV